MWKWKYKKASYTWAWRSETLSKKIEENNIKLNELHSRIGHYIQCAMWIKGMKPKKNTILGATPRDKVLSKRDT